MEFFGRNTLPTNLLFGERALYKEYALEEFKNLNLCDFLYKSPYYGKIDYEGYVVTPDEAYLGQFASPDTALGMQFVVDAFEAFEARFLSNVAERLGIRDFTTRYINFTVRKAWSGTNEEFFEYKNSLYQAFYSQVLSQLTIRKKLCNFKNFAKLYLDFLMEVALTNSPVTKIGYIKSNLTAPNISGLVLELAINQDAGDDYSKDKNWIKDKFFNLFVREAAKSGFSLDVNMPWRLVADFQHPAMAQFLNQRDLTVENMFNIAYNRVYETEYYDFKYTIVAAYNSFVSVFGEDLYASHDKNGQLMINKITRDYVDIDMLEEFPETFWLKKYFHIRNLEMGKHLSSSQQKQLTRRIISSFKDKNIDKTLKKMEKSFIKLHPLAIPKNRKDHFNYGILDPETAMYEKNNKKNKQQPERSATMINVESSFVPATTSGTSSTY